MGTLGSRDLNTSLEGMMARCRCAHSRFMHRSDVQDCLECNAPVSRPNACSDGTCCHYFRAASQVGEQQ